jgi:tetratricopeptide (TPR) repeat protein
VRTSLGRLVPELDVERAVPPPEDPWGLETLFAAVASILGALAAARPLALHLEDVHWADRSTLDLLTHVAGSPRQVPLVLTWRSGDPDVLSTHAEWLSRTRWTPGVTTVELAPLTLAETAEQLRLLTGTTPDADAVAHTHARSQGLPLYTAQLASAPLGVDLPPQLADLLDRRIGDLDGTAWRAARVLGLAQRRMRASLLRRASGLDIDETIDALRLLIRRRLLREGTGDEVELAHPLFVDAVRRRLLPGEAATVHARLAEALADEPDVEPAEVADHWRAADRPDLEVSQRVAAARRASGRFAYREALAAWSRVLELWDHGATTDDVELWDALAQALDAAVEVGDLDAGRALAGRASALHLPDRERAIVLQRIGTFLIDDGRTEEGVALLDEALALLDARPPTAELAALLAERFNFFIQAGRCDDAAVALSRGLELSETQQDDRPRRRWMAASIWLKLQTGDVEGALAVARDALAAGRTEADPMADIMVAANATDGMLRSAMPPARLEEMAADVLSTAESCNLTHSYGGILLRGNVCWAHLRAGDVASARRLLHPVTRSHPDLNSAVAHLLLGAVELREGRVPAALERCRAADAQVRNRNQNWAEGVPWHAEVELWAGQVDAALDRLQEALDVVLPSQATGNAAPLLCLRARAVADQLDAVDAPAEQRRQAVDELHGAVAKARTDPFGGRLADAAIPALSHLWHAELGRILGSPALDPWVRAADRFDGIGRPQDAAYCRWRAAEVALRGGQGTVAARVLARAAADARQHVPLAEAIAATAQGG